MKPDPAEILLRLARAEDRLAAVASVAATQARRDAAFSGGLNAIPGVRAYRIAAAEEREADEASHRAAADACRAGAAALRATR